MAPANEKNPFTELMISIMPEAGGVYVLWSQTEIIYIGSAEDPPGLRAELEEHWRGRHNPSISGIYDFQVEVCKDPTARRQELLEEYERQHGVYPAFNRAD